MIPEGESLRVVLLAEAGVPRSHDRLPAVLDAQPVEDRRDLVADGLVGNAQVAVICALSQRVR